jgi:hypothetical protein
MPRHPLPCHCVLCGGDPPGVRIVHTLIICRDCLEHPGASYPDTCSYCRQGADCHHWPSLRGAGGLPMCVACRAKFLAEIQETAAA